MTVEQVISVLLALVYTEPDGAVYVSFKEDVDLRTVVDGLDEVLKIARSHAIRPAGEPTWSGLKSGGACGNCGLEIVYRQVSSRLHPGNTWVFYPPGSCMCQLAAKSGLPSREGPEDTRAPR